MMATPLGDWKLRTTKTLYFRELIKNGKSGSTEPVIKSFQVHREKLFLHDAGNKCIFKIDEFGNVYSTIDSSSFDARGIRLSDISDFALNRDGNVCVACRYDHYHNAGIAQFSEQGTLLESFPIDVFPDQLQVDVENNFLVYSSSGQFLFHKYNATGEKVSSFFENPSKTFLLSGGIIQVDEKRNVYFASTTGSYQVLKFTSEGALHGKFMKDLTIPEIPVALEDTFRKVFREVLTRESDRMTIEFQTIVDMAWLPTDSCLVILSALGEKGLTAPYIDILDENMTYRGSIEIPRANWAVSRSDEEGNLFLGAWESKRPSIDMVIKGRLETDA